MEFVSRVLKCCKMLPFVRSRFASMVGRFYYLFIIINTSLHEPICRDQFFNGANNSIWERGDFVNSPNLQAFIIVGSMAFFTYLETWLPSISIIIMTQSTVKKCAFLIRNRRWKINLDWKVSAHVESNGKSHKGLFSFVHNICGRLSSSLRIRFPCTTTRNGHSIKRNSIYRNVSHLALRWHIWSFVIYAQDMRRHLLVSLGDSIRQGWQIDPCRL